MHTKYEYDSLSISKKYFANFNLKIEFYLYVY